MKKIVFITGTRADFGKLKPLIQAVEKSLCFEAYIFATGMHMLPYYGSTVHEILKCNFKNIYIYNNQAFQLGMDISLANTIYGFSCYVKELNPDLVIVHGDRSEALAGAIVSSFNNVRIGHIEGGEISGNIDGLIRHSITKLSHAHFVANKKAKERLLQMGESDCSIFVIGSPEVDFMLSDKLPCLELVEKSYGINFDNYAILIYHPVTFEKDKFVENTKEIVSAILESEMNYIVILPNNDSKSQIIEAEYNRLRESSKCKVFPSIRFECFMTLLKHSKFIIGNSSTGIREAPVFGVPSINIGSRQTGRSDHESIFNINEDKDKILEVIILTSEHGIHFKSCSRFGDGKSVEHFIDILREGLIWSLPIQKVFEER